MQVAAGVEVAVIEAMKMQNKLLAPRAGIVKSVLAKVHTACFLSFLFPLHAVFMP